MKIRTAEKGGMKEGRGEDTQVTPEADHAGRAESQSRLSRRKLVTPVTPDACLTKLTHTHTPRSLIHPASRGRETKQMSSAHVGIGCMCVDGRAGGRAGDCVRHGGVGGCVGSF